MITLEEVLSPENMQTACRRVIANRGAPGVDGMTVNEVRAHFEKHGASICAHIREGRYIPAAVKRVDISKPNGGTRMLGIPTVQDRVIQQAIAQVLSKHFDPLFSEFSYGFRPGKSAHQAIEQTQKYIAEGRTWVVELDLAKFFDTVNHSRLLRKLSTQIKDGRVISLICRMLKSGISINGKVEASEIGLMQGGPLSPLLANIYLDELDKELESRGHEFARYADDLVIVCKSKRAALRTLDSVTRFVENRMKLKVNREKTTVSFITGGIKFLGHGYAKLKDGFVPTVHAKSKKRLKDDLRQILARNRKMSIEEVKEALRMKLRGWCNYFKYARCRAWLSGDVDQWCRRRIRQLLWKTWKRVRTRMRALQLLGCSKEQAYQWACTRKSYWRIANSHVLSTTLNNDFLKAHNWCWPGLIWAEVGGS